MLIQQIIFLSFVLISIGMLLRSEKNRLLKKWRIAEAVIVKNIYVPNELALFKPIDPNDDETATYYPIIQFKTAEDKTIVKQLETSFYPPRTVGKKMVVLYNPNNPASLITYPKVKLEIVPNSMITIGLIGLTISLLEVFRIISLYQLFQIERP